jgi:capsid protein
VTHSPTLPVYFTRKKEQILRDSKQLKAVITQIEALKTLDKSADFTAGVAAAQAVITTILQEAADLERMQKLESELAELRAKYPSTEQATPKKRGRKPKDSNNPTQASLIEEKQAQPS